MVWQSTGQIADPDDREPRAGRPPACSPSGKRRPAWRRVVLICALGYVLFGGDGAIGRESLQESDDVNLNPRVVPAPVGHTPEPHIPSAGQPEVGTAGGPADVGSEGLPHRQQPPALSTKSTLYVPRPSTWCHR